MKSERGITLISVTVYIIAITILIGVITVISRYFYTNTKSVSQSIDPVTQFTKFNTFFSDEVNHENIKVLECNTDEGSGNSYIVFDNGVQYTFIKNNILLKIFVNKKYRNKVKICDVVENCTFSQTIKNGKSVVNVLFAVKDKSYTQQYTLKM